MFFSYKKIFELVSTNKNLLTVKNLKRFIKKFSELKLLNFNEEDNFSNIKFGKLLDCYKNPNSDRLYVCNVLVDWNNIYTIQTTDSSVINFVNHFIFVILPGGKINDFVCKEKKLKKIESQGMMLSFEEVGFDKELLSKELLSGVQVFSKNEKISFNNNPIDYFNVVDYLVDGKKSFISYFDLCNQLIDFFNYKKPKIFNYSLLFDFSWIKEEENYTKVFSTKKYTFYIPLKEQLLLVKSKFKLGSFNENLINYIHLLTGVIVKVSDFVDKKKISFSRFISNEKRSLILNIIDNFFLKNKQKFCLLKYFKKK